MKIIHISRPNLNHDTSMHERGSVGTAASGDGRRFVPTALRTTCCMPRIEACDGRSVLTIRERSVVLGRSAVRAVPGRWCNAAPGRRHQFTIATVFGTRIGSEAGRNGV
jgi:hypothetical protein